MSGTEQFVLLWSHAGNDLRIEPLEKVLSANRDAYRDNRPVGYVPVYIGSRACVAACAGHCQVTLIDREMEQQQGALNLAPAAQGEPA